MTTKTHQKTKVRNLRKLLEELKPADLAGALGVNPDTIRKWDREGEMPTVASVACEALIRRRGKGVGGRALLIVSVPDDKAQEVSDVLSALGADARSVNVEP